MDKVKKTDNTDLISDPVKYPPMTPQESAAALGVPLSQKLQPALADHMPNRFVTLEEAQARGWSMFWIGKACRLGHQAARYVSNPRRCSGCDRDKKDLPQVYPISAAGTFYKPERIARKQPDGTVIAPTTTPTAQASVKPLEPSKKEQDFLEALAMTGDFDKAAESTGMTRGKVEARASVDSVFKAALTDLCDRLGIAWTRAVDQQAFKWTPEIEHQLVRRFVDLGLIEAARQECGVSAYDYHQHLKKSSKFAEAIEEARPAARATLRERATALADKGKPELLKYLSDEDAQSDGEFITLAGGQRVRISDPEADRAFLAGVLADVKKNLDAQDRLKAVCIARAAEQQKPVVAEPDDNTASVRDDDDDSLTGELT